MDEEKKNAVVAAAKLIRDYCRGWPENCGTCMLFEMGCKSYNLPRDWEFPGDLPPVEPCPFCGGKAMVFDKNLIRGVVCLSCSARIPADSSVEDDILDAVERWNRRANGNN